MTSPVRSSSDAARSLGRHLPPAASTLAVRRRTLGVVAGLAAIAALIAITAGLSADARPRGSGRLPLIPLGPVPIVPVLYALFHP